LSALRKRASSTAKAERGQEQVLDRDVLVAHLAGLLLGGREHGGEFLRQVDLVGRIAGAGHLRRLAQIGFERALEGVGRHVHAAEQARDQPVLGLDQRDEQVRDVDLLVAERDGLGLGELEGFLRLLGELLGVHAGAPWRCVRA
jgi:hypothetical protein